MPMNRALAAAARETSSVVFAQAVAALQRAHGDRRVLGRRRRRADPGARDAARSPSAGCSSRRIPWEQFERGGEFTPFTPIVNVTGQPAAAVPFDVVDGLPVGVQLIGPPAGEAVLLRLAAQIEAAHPWADRLPR